MWKNVRPVQEAWWHAAGAVEHGCCRQAPAASSSIVAFGRPWAGGRPTLVFARGCCMYARRCACLCCRGHVSDMPCFCRAADRVISNLVQTRLIWLVLSVHTYLADALVVSMVGRHLDWVKRPCLAVCLWWWRSLLLHLWLLGRWRRELVGLHKIGKESYINIAISCMKNHIMINIDRQHF